MDSEEGGVSSHLLLPHLTLSHLSPHHLHSLLFLLPPLSLKQKGGL